MPPDDDSKKTYQNDPQQGNEQTLQGATPFIEYGPDQNVAGKGFGKKRTAALVISLCLIFSAMTGAGDILVGRRLGREGSSGGLNFGQPKQDGALYGCGEGVLIQRADGTATTVGGYVDVYKNCADTVVEILAEHSDYDNSTSTGSGVVIGRGESTGFVYVMTNNHVVENCETIMAKSRSGEEYETTLIGSDWLSDIAVVRVHTTDLTPAVFGDSDTLRVGEDVAAIGYPLGYQGGSITDGIVSVLSRDVVIEGVPMLLLQTTADINPGNSGGGLFNMAGQLVGIVNAKTSGAAIGGIGYAIPVNTALSCADQIITNGYVAGVPDLDLSLSESTNGLVVVKDYDHASELGSTCPDIRAGDILYRVNGVKVTTMAEYRGALAGLVNAEKGTVVKLHLLRRGRSIALSVPLREGGNATEQTVESAFRVS